MLDSAGSGASEPTRSQFFHSYTQPKSNMSDYTIEKREELSNTLISRVVENAPLREIVRVYSEAVNAAVGQLSDADLARSVAAAGYTDILEAFNLEVPAEETAPEAE